MNTAGSSANSTMRMANLHPVVHNVIISNIPGPPLQIYVCGAPIEAMYPLGPIFHGAGLNITVMSNAGRMHVGVIACRESMPDVDDLVFIKVATGIGAGIGMVLVVVVALIALACLGLATVGFVPPNPASVITCACTPSSRFTVSAHTEPGHATPGMKITARQPNVRAPQATDRP